VLDILTYSSYDAVGTRRMSRQKTGEGKKLFISSKKRSELFAFWPYWGWLHLFDSSL